MNTANLMACCWPVEDLGSALQALAQAVWPDKCTTAPATDALTAPATVLHGPAQAWGDWLAWASARLGLETEAVATLPPDVPSLLQHGGPALWRIRTELGEGLLLLLPARTWPWPGSPRVRLLTPAHRVQTVLATVLQQALLARLQAPFASEVQALLATAGVPPSRQARARAAMLSERVADHPVGTCSLLRLPPSASLRAHARDMRLTPRLGRAMGMFATVYALEIIGWGLIGHATLSGRLDMGWLIAWALLIFTLIPLRLLGQWLDARVAIDLARRVKSRLLLGALQSPPDQVKTQGAGQLLAQVLESQALEGLIIQGGFGTLVAVLELVFATGTLLAGAGGWLHVGLLLACVGVGLWLLLRFHPALQRWTRSRLHMTHDLVEQMVGHRTRLVQQQGQRHTDQQDQALAAHAQDARTMDERLLPIVGLLPRGWMLVGLIGLAPAFVQATATGGASAGMAVGLGGMLLAYRALGGLSTSLASLSRAAIAWQACGPLWRNAAAPPTPAHFIAAPSPTTPSTLPSTPPPTHPPLLLDASALRLQHRPDAPAVFSGLGLQLHRGERVLLQGASGGGKSSLAAVLSGLREPQQGLLLVQGWDRHTLGTQWRQWVSHAPQFHDNHILSASLAFNLLMGRQWPPSEDDLQEAQTLCEALGLGELLARMPAGLMQMVGDTGWRLSHGEASRIYLARALLKGAPLTVLDESFAALDPDTLGQCLQCAWDHSDTLMVVAHP